jgi:hypothetical protein
LKASDRFTLRGIARICPLMVSGTFLLLLILKRLRPFSDVRQIFGSVILGCIAELKQLHWLVVREQISSRIHLAIALL